MNGDSNHLLFLIKELKKLSIRLKKLINIIDKIDFKIKILSENR